MEYAFEELQFFEDHASSWTLYQNLREKLEVLCPETIIQVKNTQISLKNKYIYACVSFLPVHPKNREIKPISQSLLDYRSPYLQIGSIKSLVHTQIDGRIMF